MRVHMPVAGQRYGLSYVTLSARAEQQADGSFCEDGTADFPPRDTHVVTVLGPIDEDHAPCRIGAKIYWIPIEHLVEIDGLRAGGMGAAAVAVFAGLGSAVSEPQRT